MKMKKRDNVEMTWLMVFGSCVFPVSLGIVTYRGTAVNLPRHGGKLTAARWQTYRGAAVSDEAACRSDEVHMQE